MKWTLLILGTLVITSAGFIAAGQSYDYPHLNLVAEGIEAPDCMDVPKLVVNGGVQCSEQAMDQWLREMRAWRAQRRIRMGYDTDLYGLAQLKWTQSSFIQPQMMMEDRYFYDPVAHKYTVDRYLEDV